jgi:hypothetical protein
MAAVIAHPLCGLGTALLIYWHGAPGYYLQYGARFVGGSTRGFTSPRPA